MPIPPHRKLFALLPTVRREGRRGGGHARSGHDDRDRHQSSRIGNAPEFSGRALVSQAKTTSKDKPDPVITSSSLKVELTKVNGSWLIENFEALTAARP